ncbi:unnamed protein product [Pleuronectes platessa]|uniref:Uncharacterized protein n=1 Tax=Pleuronectes platessa TaxID=8262 RepID=A0A9N7U4N7_PLEPL|nr:unnamed protein product [Pleuronectes platessa]
MEQTKKSRLLALRSFLAVKGILKEATGRKQKRRRMLGRGGASVAEPRIRSPELDSFKLQPPNDTLTAEQPTPLDGCDPSGAEETAEEPPASRLKGG